MNLMTPLVLVDTQVILHQIAGSLEGLQVDIETRRALTQAQLCYVNSGHWCYDVLGPTRVLWVNDKKQHGEYWRHQYLKREDIWSQVPRKPRGRPSESKRLRFLELRERYSEPLEYYRAFLADENIMPNGFFKDVETMVSLADQLTIHYKAGRSFPGYALQVVRGVFSDLVHQGRILELGYLGYEADDMASLVVRSRPDQDLLLLTIDSDWLGLCSDKVTWCCAIGYSPRVRFMADGSLQSWAKRRLKADISDPRDIWALKAEQGDPSDSLPPGSPLGVIDLLEPVAEFDLFKTQAVREHVAALVDKAPENPMLDKAPEAVAYIKAHGMPFAAKPLEDRDFFIPTIDKDTLTPIVY